MTARKKADRKVPIEPREAKADFEYDRTAGRARSVMETRVFRSGNSYAVRLPRLLYGGGEGAMNIRRLADGRYLIEPKRKRRWPAGFFESFHVADDFEAPPRSAHDPARDRRDARLFESES